MFRTHRPVPVGLDEMFVLAFQAGKRIWKPILGTTFSVWSVFAFLFVSWLFLTFHLDFLQENLIDSLGANGGIDSSIETENIIKNSLLLILGLPFFVFLYIASVSFLSLATINLVANSHSNSPASKCSVPYRDIIKESAVRTPKMVGVYVVLVGLFILLSTIFVGSAFLLGLVISPNIEPTLILVYFIVVLPAAFFVGFLVWLLIYSRWVFVGQATALLKVSSNPFSVSNQVVRGRSFNLLGRVLLITVLIAVGVSTLSFGLVFFELGPLVLFLIAILVRILFSLISSVLLAASITPLYIKLEEN